MRKVDYRQIHEGIEKSRGDSAGQIVRRQVDGGNSAESTVESVDWFIARVLTVDSKPIRNDAFGGRPAADTQLLRHR